MADSYDVTGQIKTTVFRPGGVGESIVRISYKTKPSGIVGSIDVPDTETDYTVDNVKQLLDVAAANAEAIQGL